MRNFICICIALLWAFTTSAQSYKVVVNNSNNTSSITKAEASNYFLKKRIKWSNGTEVVPVDLNSKSQVREAFSKDIHGKTIAQVRAFWQQSVFAGKATPPTEMDSDAKVIEFVKSNAGGIGYVSASANIQGVKILTIN